MKPELKEVTKDARKQVEARDRAMNELQQVAGVLELVRYYLEAEAWRDGCAGRAESSAPRPAELEPVDVAALLYDAHRKVRAARDVLLEQ